MIRAIDRKLLRDVWNVRGQALAIALVIGCGVATYVMSLCTVTSLRRTQGAYYDRCRFADVFVQLKRAPASLAARLAEIPGVGRVDTRVVSDVTLDVPGLPEPAVGRLISLPERPDVPGLNAVYLRLGRLPEPRRDNEVVASEAFALAHKFKPGDSVSAVINGRKRRLVIVGVGLSPEYIFQFRAGDLFPDDKRFGVFWMGRQPLEAAFDLDGAFNDATLTLTPGAGVAEVVRRIDRLTEEYGGLGAYGRADQVSHHFVTDEMEQLEKMSGIAPTIFLGVAAFLLNVVLGRIVYAQREQIAALKAFGYSNLAVGWHYAQFTLVVVAAGVAVGIGVGVLLGHWMAGLYARFYRFPELSFHPDPRVFLDGVVFATVMAFIGTIATVRRAVKLPPAEAMRPPAPASFKPTVVERLGCGRLLSPVSRMILRNLERKPVNSLLSVVGIAMAAAILIMGFFIGDAFDHIIDVQFEYASRETLSVSFVEPEPRRVLSELVHLPGVTRCEPFRSVAVRLRAGPRSRRMALQGVDRDARVHRLIDDRLRQIELPDDGVVLGAKLAQILGVKPGDLLTVEVLEGERPTRLVPVAGLVEEFIGANAYMDRRALNRLMREGPSVSGGYLSAEAGRVGELYDTLKRRPGVAAVSVRKAQIDNFNAVQAENMKIIRGFYIAFGMVIAVGVVYNAAHIALAERGRELASMRVLGFTRAEISAILLGELAVLVLVAIPVGLVLGYGLATLVAQTLAVESLRLPVVIFPATYSYASLVILGAAVGSGLAVRRKLDQLDLVAVLKMQA